MTKETKQALWAMGIATCFIGFLSLFRMNIIAVGGLCVYLGILIVKERDKIIIADEFLMDENILIKEENKLKAKENHKLKTKLQELEYDHFYMFKIYSKRDKLGKLSLFEQSDLNKLEDKYNKTLVFTASEALYAMKEMSKRYTTNNVTEKS